MAQISHAHYIHIVRIRVVVEGGPDVYAAG